MTCSNFVFSSWSRVWVQTFCQFQKYQFLLKCFKQKSILSKVLAQESLIQLIIQFTWPLALNFLYCLDPHWHGSLPLSILQKKLYYSISNVIWSNLKLQKLHLPILLLVMVQALLTGRTYCRSVFLKVTLNIQCRRKRFYKFNNNNNGERLCETCNMNELVITGTYLPPKSIHQAMWVSLDRKTGIQIICQLVTGTGLQKFIRSDHCLF